MLWSGRAQRGSEGAALGEHTQVDTAFSCIAPCLSAACRMLDVTACRESCDLLSMESLVFSPLILLFLEEAFLSTGRWVCSDDTCLAWSQTLAVERSPQDSGIARKHFSFLALEDQNPSPLSLQHFKLWKPPRQQIISSAVR